jgi:hypothetical protein
MGIHMPWRGLLVLFFAALSLRLIFWVFVLPHPERAFDIDSVLYARLGETLLGSGTFPNILRTPGYPVFLAALYAVFGKVPHAVLAVQCVIDSGTAVIAAMLFYRLFQNRRYSLVTGVIYSVNPFSIFYANMVLTETLFTFVLLTAVYQFFLFLHDTRKGRLVLASLLLGVGALCRPISLLLPLLFVPSLFIAQIKVRDKVVSCIVFLMLYCMVLLPWYMRNYHVYGQWTLSTAAKYNVLVNFAPEVLMGKDNPLSLLHIRVNDLIAPYVARMWHITGTKCEWRTEDCSRVFDDRTEAAALTEAGMRIIRDDPHIFVLARLLSIGRVMSPFFPRFHIFTGKEVAALSFFSFGVDFLTMAFFLAGIFFSLRKRPADKIHAMAIMNMIVLILFFALIPGIAGGTRFRVPVLPYVAVFSATGILNLANRKRPLK